jgi:uncharacterized protein HemX
MAATTNMNIILGQGNAVNEVHNVRKQNLEMNQQFVAQETEGKKKEDKVKVQKFEATDKVAIQEDEEKRDKKDAKDKRKKTTKRKTKKKTASPEGHRIDIRV